MYIMRMYFLRYYFYDGTYTALSQYIRDVLRAYPDIMVAYVTNNSTFPMGTC